MRLGKIKKAATGFLEKYKSENPATYAAAEQAIGGILILDGFIGIDNPLGGKKRPGIFGSLIGVVVGIVFILVPTFFNNISGIKDMTATTTATVVSVNNSESACSVTAKYFVNGTEYNQTSSSASSGNCSLTKGSTIQINYNPSSPGAWDTSTKSYNLIMTLFVILGVIAIISGIVTFIIRLLSIIFGWKLLQHGRKLAKELPEGTNIETVINEIKQEFSKTLFNFSGQTNIPSQTVQNLNTPMQQLQQPIQPEETSGQVSSEALQQPSRPVQSTDQSIESTNNHNDQIN